MSDANIYIHPPKDRAMCILEGLWVKLATCYALPWQPKERKLHPIGYVAQGHLWGDYHPEVTLTAVGRWTGDKGGRTAECHHQWQALLLPEPGLSWRQLLIIFAATGRGKARGWSRLRCNGRG